MSQCLLRSGDGAAVHQPYSHIMKLPGVRFLLADDAGTGKTIMAGLLIRELKLRGLAERVLVVCPANLTFQWQRELKEKFGQQFFVLKGGNIRNQFGVNRWLSQKQVITSLDLAKREGILPGLRQVQWSLTLQSVERLTSVIVLPHPDADDPEVKRLRTNGETEMTAMQVVMDYEKAQGRQVDDVHEKNLGYDVTSLDGASGELRLIEVKGPAAETGAILTPPTSGASPKTAATATGSTS